MLTIGAPHVILKIYKVYPYTIVYSIGVDPIYFKNCMGSIGVNPLYLKNGAWGALTCIYMMLIRTANADQISHLN